VAAKVEPSGGEILKPSRTHIESLPSSSIGGLSDAAVGLQPVKMTTAAVPEFCSQVAPAIDVSHAESSRPLSGDLTGYCIWMSTFIM